MHGKVNFLKNRFLSNCDYNGKNVYLRGYPVEITIELTNCCNLDCIYCPHSKMKRKQGFMNVSLFKKIVNEISGFVEAVDLDLMGESTLHPKIFEMIQYCKKASLKTLLCSNMTKVDAIAAKRLYDSGLDVLVMGIDGVQKDTYESIRRGATFEQTKENIDAFLTLESKGLYKVVQMVYVIQNMHELKQFITHWCHKGADFVRTQPYQNVDRQNIELNALPMRARKHRRPCIFPWKKIAVCWDGTVVLCCNDYDKFKVIGDANKQDIFEIWNGELMQECRKQLVAQDWNGLPFCKDCYPFEPSNIVLWGGIFVNPVQIRKLLFLLEKLMVFHRIYFFRYL